MFVRDLLKPESSNLYRSQRANQVRNKGSFKQAFLNELQNTSTQMRTSEDLLGRYAQGDVSIYFPYADFFEQTAAITIVPADREGDEAPGFISNGRGGYTEIPASDEYSKTNPCHLISVVSMDSTESAVYSKTEGVEPLGRCAINFLGTPENLLPPPPPPPGHALPDETRTAYIGYSRCTQQYDAWISFTGNGGGSEIKYSRGEPTYK